MKVFTTDQTRRADDFTIRNEPVASIDLMERAARAMATRIMASCPVQVPLQVFAGFGNNGGDGVAMARILAESGRRVELYVVHSDKGYSPDAQANLDRLHQVELSAFSYVGSIKDLPSIPPDHWVVDALFGSGLTREPEGIPAGIIDHINRSGAHVVSVDIPSGLFGEDNSLNTRKHVIRASETLALQAPRLSLFFPENYPFTGDWQVVPIGLHPEFIRNEETPYYYLTREDIRIMVKSRNRTDHKGVFGHALLVAGSSGKGGAAILAASACLRSGCGLLTLRIPGSVNPLLQVAVPEAMTDPDPDPDRWTLPPAIDRYDAMGLGPGIGTDPRTVEALLSTLDRAAKPLVLDADALNILAQDPENLTRIPKNSLLTPHPGEYKRLFGDDPDEYTQMQRLREITMRHELIVILKRSMTLIALPDGSVWFNTTGNPGMATAGAGDVLTGILVSLLAQGYKPVDAARVGVYLHGLAGDIAAAESGMEALIARDIVASIGKAFNRIKTIKS